MAKRKRFKNGKLICSGCGVPKNPDKEYYNSKAGYCKKCQVSYLLMLRKRKRMLVEQAIESTRKQEHPHIAIIRDQFNKAVEAAQLKQDYQHYLVNSIALTDSFLGTKAKDNPYRISEYSHLRISA